MKFPARTTAESAKTVRTRDAGREGDNREGRGQREGCASRTPSQVLCRGRRAAGCAVQGKGEVGSARRARSSEPTPAGGGGESGEQQSGAPGTPWLVKVTVLELG